MIPQPGVYEIEQMDYIFVQTCRTKQAIRRKIRRGRGGRRRGPAGDTRQGRRLGRLTQNIAYFRNEAGGMTCSLGGGQGNLLADYDDYQGPAPEGVRRVRRAGWRGVRAVRRGKWRDEAQDELEVPRA